MGEQQSSFHRDGEAVRRLAHIAFADPQTRFACPKCDRESTFEPSWFLKNVRTRMAEFEVRCRTCDFAFATSIELSADALPCWPLDRIGLMAEAIEQECIAIAAKVQQHVQAMPAAQFTTHPLWAEAMWSATTYQWHPTSDAPPVMGLVFDNIDAGLQIFRDAEQQMNHEDRFEEIRISIIEGDVINQSHRPGYSVHICADPEALCGHATMSDFVVDPSVIPFLGQWNRHYPVLGVPALLPRFKSEFAKHQEFLLAPTVVKQNGQRYIVPELGIVKNTLLFRKLTEITAPDDIDVAAHVLPQVIVPPSEGQRR